MPKFNYKDIKEETRTGENYSPNRAKTSPNTYDSLTNKAKLVTKLVQKTKDAAVSYLAVGDETTAKTEGQKPILLKPEMIKAFVINGAKKMQQAMSFLNINAKNDSLEETNDPMIVPAEEEVSDDSFEIGVENNSSNMEESTASISEPSENPFDFGIETANGTVPVNPTETTEVEKTKEDDDKTVILENGGLDFDTMFNFGQPRNNEATKNSFEETQDGFGVGTGQTGNYVSEMQQSLENVTAPFTPFSQNPPESQEPTEDTKESGTEHSYASMGASSQLYDECRRLSYIVNSYTQQQSQFEEELNKEREAKEKLLAQIAEHDENIRNIEQNRTNAYEVYLKAKEELEPIAALFGNGIATDATENYNDSMDAGFRR